MREACWELFLTVEIAPFFMDSIGESSVRQIVLGSKFFLITKDFKPSRTPHRTVKNRIFRSVY